mmetsp:Transcript_22977/g.49872  ORF Transcript_22977/g.49872 Transcript_22977/m.49872 type:complete len:422 (-) Transcript_22977:86-1351(-)
MNHRRLIHPLPAAYYPPPLQWQVPVSPTLRVRANCAAAAAAAARTAARTPAKSVEATKAADDAVPLGKVFAAMLAGVATVSGFTFAAETATASDVPPFDPAGQRYDQGTFSGRFFRMLLACDPRLLTYTEDDARRAGEMVANYRDLIANPPAGVENIHRALWEAQRISGASLHPDSGDVIPAPFRMSGYVPFNGPICVAMVASKTTPALLFWSWVNQSQNALVNYFNRNASSEMSNETMMKSYGIAVASALTVAFGLATFVQRRYDPVTAKKLMGFVAFPSAVVASSLNCYIVRSPEIDTGISLVDADGNDVLPGETSVEAARRGVNSTTLSRAILQAPVYFVPPLLLRTAFKGFVASNPALTVPLTTYLLLVSFGIGLPSTVAIFPQMSEIKADEAEEKYQNLRDKDGKPYEVFYYNKGL